MTSKKGKPQPNGVGMTPSKTELGRFIRSRRLELNLRQGPLAKQVGISQTVISGWEIGNRNYLNDRQLSDLAKALQVEVDELRKRMPVKPGSEPKTELGKLIRSRREELGLSLSAFANKLGVTPQQAKKLELKKNPNILYSLVSALASSLDLQPSIIAKFAGATRKQSSSELGQLVRLRRKELGISTCALAKKLNVSRQLVNQIEFGWCPLSESDEMIARLAQILELEVSQLEAVRPKRRLKQVSPTNPLGRFLVSKRFELKLTQREVAEKANMSVHAVCGIERGTYRPSGFVLGKISKALECEIPAELVPIPAKRGRPRTKTALEARASSNTVQLSDQDVDHLEKIKELSGIRLNTEAVHCALKFFRHLLEEQSEGCVVCVRKDNGLEFIF